MNLTKEDVAPGVYIMARYGNTQDYHKARIRSVTSRGTYIIDWGDNDQKFRERHLSDFQGKH